MYHIGMTQWVFGNEPLERSFIRLSKCGYDGIEFAAEPDALDASECLALMKKYSINCKSLCGIFNEDRDLTASGEQGEKAVTYLMKSVDFAEKVGAKIIIVVPSPVGRTVQPEGTCYDRLIDNAVCNIRRAADYTQQHGVKLAIECINRYETYFINTMAKGFDLVKKIDHPAVGIMADFFHMSIEERSIPGSLDMVRDYLLHVHIADNTREAAGLGHTDFKEALKTLKNIGYDGSLTMEFMNRLANPYASTDIGNQAERMDRNAKQSIDYIRMIERSIEFEEN
jgi:D-psicose/D-tagatose/L-ribulose 3-epimerase